MKNGLPLDNACKTFEEDLVLHYYGENNSVERRRVERRGRASMDDNGSSSRIVLQRDVGWQRQLNAYRCVLRDPGHAVGAIVKAVVAKERIIWVGGQTRLCI